MQLIINNKIKKEYNNKSHFYHSKIQHKKSKKLIKINWNNKKLLRWCKKIMKSCKKINNKMLIPPLKIKCRCHNHSKCRCLNSHKFPCLNYLKCRCNNFNQCLNIINFLCLNYLICKCKYLYNQIIFNKLDQILICLNFLIIWITNHRSARKIIRTFQNNNR